MSTVLARLKKSRGVLTEVWFHGINPGVRVLALV